MSADIETLLATAADDADQPLRYSVEEIVQRGRRSVRHRRIAAAFTAVLTAAVIVGGVAVWHGGRDAGFGPAEIGKTQPAPPVSPLTDAEIIKRCGQNDKEWLESEQNRGTGDKAGPVGPSWRVAAKTGQGNVFLALLVSPDRSVVATCHMEGLTISTGESSYGRFLLKDTPALPSVPDVWSTTGVPVGSSWGRVPETVTRMVAVPRQGEPREALVANGFFIWGLQDHGNEGISTMITAYTVKGETVFTAERAIPPR